MLYHTSFETPFWEIILVGDEEGLTNLHLVTGEGKRDFALDASWKRDDALFREAREQVIEYFAGERRQFTVRLNPRGTPFQRRVWRALRTIPHGETRTYRDMATLLGNPKATRAVGLANSRNPIPLIVPCHRVIGSNGQLTGFAHGLQAKQRLLDFERGAL